MSDELPKKVFSVPPPPTDEIDSEWGSKGADESGKTATQAAEEATTPGKDTGPAGADAQLKEELKGQGETAAAPSTPPPPSHAEEEEEDEEESDDEDDEDDEEEEEEEAHHVSHASHAPVTGSARAPGSDDWLPDWAPWAVLAGLIVLGVIGGLGAFSKPPAEGADEKSGAPAAAANAVPTSIEASHFLVQYKGSMRAPESITRTKEEAKKRAEEGLAKAKKGGDFAKIVAEYSDEPGAAARGGALGEFQATQMVKPFSDAAFKLKVGQMSGLVETDFGYHVIKRTK